MFMLMNVHSLTDISKWVLIDIVDIVKAILWQLILNKF